MLEKFDLILLTIFAWVLLVATTIFLISSPPVFSAVFETVHENKIVSKAYPVFNLTVPFWQVVIGDAEDKKPAQLTDAEISHLVDIKILLTNLYIYAIICGGFITLRLIFYKTSFAKVSKLLLFSTLIFLLLTLAVALISWNWFFEKFHSLFFTAGSWQFPRDSILLEFFPQNFWQVYGIVFGVAFLLLVVLFWILLSKKS
ncbi:MAG: DUF1461 domain-containing protein [Microgenomates group bacterium]